MSRKLNIESRHLILFKNEPFTIYENVLSLSKKNFSVLRNSAFDKIAYEIKFGVTSSAQYWVNREFLNQREHHIIRNHSGKDGENLIWLDLNTIIIVRFNNLRQAKSKTLSEHTYLLVEVIKNYNYPLMSEHKAIEISDYLVQLTHITSALIAEGEIIHANTLLLKKACIFKYGFRYLNMHIKKIPYFTNETLIITGIDLVKFIYTKSTHRVEAFISFILNEIGFAYDYFISVELTNKKHYDECRHIVKLISRLNKNNSCFHKLEKYFYNRYLVEIIKEHTAKLYFSSYYKTIILELVSTILISTEKILINKINLIFENSIIDNENIYWGEYFQGNNISFEKKKLKITFTILILLHSEKFTDLFHDSINIILISFVNLEVFGLNCRFQAIQITTISMALESQIIINPIYVHYMSKNNDNQIKARIVTNYDPMPKSHIVNSYKIVCFLFLRILQTINYLKIRNKVFLTKREEQNEVSTIFSACAENSLI